MIPRCHFVLASTLLCLIGSTNRAALNAAEPLVVRPAVYKTTESDQQGLIHQTAFRRYGYYGGRVYRGYPGYWGYGGRGYYRPYYGYRSYGPGYYSTYGYVAPGYAYPNYGYGYYSPYGYGYVNPGVQFYW